MDLTGIEPPVTPSDVPLGARPREHPCDGCGTPLAADQRYCVQCGRRRRDADDPAARWLAGAAERRRRPARAIAGRSTPAGRTRLVGPAMFLALLPIAVAFGVLVGRGGGGTDDQALLKALRAQRAITPARGATATAAAAAVKTDFGLDHGWVVEVATLPVAGTDQAKADAAKASAEAKGATHVGVLSPADVRTSPDHGQETYVVYSGEFAKRAQAEKALRKLRAKFPGAKVVEVTASAGGAGGRADAANGGTVIAHSRYGDAHQVTGFKPTKAKLEADKKVVRRLNDTVGKKYIETQRNLPDVIVVTKDPGAGSNKTPTGGGD
jgi:hypothetical protein